MAKIRKNLLLLVLSLAMVLSCFVGVMPFMNKVAKASGEPETYTYQMIGGAQVRKVDDDSAGLRFVSYIDARGYDENAGLTYGMLIAPLDYIQDANKGALTPANVFGNDAKYCVTDGCTTCGKAHIINLTSDKLVDVTSEVTKAELAEDGQSYVGFKGVITRIKEDNYLRKFVGLAYVYDASNVENPYTFVEYNENNARSVAFVAKKSLDAGIEDTPEKRLAEYVKKSYGAYTFDASIDGVTFNEKINATATLTKGEETKNQENLEVSVKGLESYQYANGKVVSGKAIDKQITVTVSMTSPDGAYTYAEDFPATVDGNGYVTLPDVSVGLNRTSSEINVGVAGNYTMSVDGVNVESTTSNGVVTFNNSVLSATSGYGYKTATVVDGDKKYALDVEIFDTEISTTKEFVTWYGSAGNSNPPTKSAFVTADIDLGTTYLQISNAANAESFNTVFDGKNRVITGGQFVYGILPRVANGGVIRNANFVDFYVYNTNSAGFLGDELHGKIENCYFRGTRDAVSGDWLSSFYRYISNTAKIKNVVVIGNEKGTAQTYQIGKVLYNVQPAQGLYIVNNNATRVSEDEFAGTYGVYTSKEDFATVCDGQLPTGFSADYWTLNTDGTIVPIRARDSIKLEDAITTVVDESDVVINTGVNNTTFDLLVNTVDCGSVTSNGLGEVVLSRSLFTSWGLHAVELLVRAGDLVTSVYSANVEVYNRLIGTAAEFKAWFNTGTGYNGIAKNTEWVLLTADIDLNAVSLTAHGTHVWGGSADVAFGFEGVLNGNGYVISNAATTGGLFNLNSAGVIKNLVVVNATTTRPSGYGGLIGVYGFGTIENCYFQGSISGTAADRASTMFAYASGIKLNSVVVEATDVSTPTNADGGYNAGKNNGLYVVSNASNLKGTSTNSKAFTSKTDFETYCAGALPAGLSSDFWTIGADGTPVPRALADFTLEDKNYDADKVEDVEADINIPNVKTAVEINGEFVGYVESDAEGVVVINASNFANDGEYSVVIYVVDNNMYAEQFSFVVNVVISTTTLKDVNYVIGSEDLTVNTGKANANVDVLIADQSIGVLTTDENGVLTISSSNFTTHGNYEIEIQVLNNDAVIAKLLFNVEVYDRAISTADEFVEWYNKDEEKSYNGIAKNTEWVILTADIDLTDVVLTAHGKHVWGGNADVAFGFEGTLNGNGYVISNAATTGGLFNLNKAGVIKNLVVVNTTTTRPDGYGGLLGVYAFGRIENCYFQGSILGSAADRASSMFSYALNIVINSVVVEVTDVSSPTYADGGYYAGTNNGLYVVSNAANFKGTSTNSALYANKSAFATACAGALPAGLSSDFWTLDKNGVPTPIRLLEATKLSGEYNVVINGEDLVVNMGINNTTFDAYISGNLIGQYNSGENGIITISNDYFTTSGLKSIEFTAKINGLVAKYSVDVEVYDRAIGTKEEFLAWWKKDEESGHAGILDNDEWVILTANIDLGGEKLTSASIINPFTTTTDVGFGGTFNGDGYRITNCKTLQGLFPIIEKTGVIKNLAVLDLYTLYDIDGVTQYGSGGFTTLFAGKIVNCYIHMHLEKTETKYIGVIAQRGFVGSSLKNVVIDAKNVYANPAIFHESGYTIKSMENVYVVWNKATFDAESGAPTNFNGGTNTNSFVYKSLADMNATVTEVPENFDSGYWTYDATRGLIMNSALAYTPVRAAQ